MPPINIAGSGVSGLTIDGQNVQEATVDGDVVWTANAIPDSVVNRWLFDEGSGMTIADTTRGDDGTISGATWTSGVGNGGYHLDFDGTDDYVTTPAVPATGSQNRTFACWINTTSASGYLAEYGTNADSERWAVSVNSGMLRIEIGGSGYSSSLNINTGSWEPVAVVLDGSAFGDHFLYHDGATESAAGSTTVNTGSNSGAFFGRRFWENAYHYLGGLDDPIYWNRALTSSELDDWVAATEDNYL